MLQIFKCIWPTSVVQRPKGCEVKKSKKEIKKDTLNIKSVFSPMLKKPKIPVLAQEVVQAVF